MAKYPLPPPPDVPDFYIVLRRHLRRIDLIRQNPATDQLGVLTEDDMKVGKWMQVCEQIRLENLLPDD